VKVWAKARISDGKQLLGPLDELPGVERLAEKGARATLGRLARDPVVDLAAL
jgi:hypothetical protein